MTFDSPRPVLDRSDFDRCFVDEPDDVAPTLVLLAARRSLRRRRLLATLAALVAAAIGGLLISVLGHGPLREQPGPDTAVPSQPPPVATQPPVPSPVVQSPPSKIHRLPPGVKDEAPKLGWRNDGGNGRYRDRAGLTATDVQGKPFDLTVQTLQATVPDHLDPRREHLSPGNSAVATDWEGSVQVSQGFKWQTRDEPLNDLVQVAVTRLPPGTRVKLADNRWGLCPYTDSTGCQTATISGTTVRTALLPNDGGFVIDLVQSDGEIGSIIVRASLQRTLVTPDLAVSLLRNHQLDVVG